MYAYDVASKYVVTTSLSAVRCAIQESSVIPPGVKARKRMRARRRRSSSSTDSASSSDEQGSRSSVTLWTITAPVEFELIAYESSRRAGHRPHCSRLCSFHATQCCLLLLGMPRALDPEARTRAPDARSMVEARS